MERGDPLEPRQTAATGASWAALQPRFLQIRIIRRVLTAESLIDYTPWGSFANRPGFCPLRLIPKDVKGSMALEARVRRSGTRRCSVRCRPVVIAKNAFGLLPGRVRFLELTAQGRARGDTWHMVAKWRLWLLPFPPPLWGTPAALIQEGKAYTTWIKLTEERRFSVPAAKGYCGCREPRIKGDGGLRYPAKLRRGWRLKLTPQWPKGVLPAGNISAPNLSFNYGYWAGNAATGVGNEGPITNSGWAFKGLLGRGAYRDQACPTIGYGLRDPSTS